MARKVAKTWLEEALEARKAALEADRLAWDAAKGLGPEQPAREPEWDAWNAAWGVALEAREPDRQAAWEAERLAWEAWESVAAQILQV